MDEKTMQYVCAICGESYEHVEDRIKCETKCLKDLKAAEEKKRLIELEANKNESTKAINDILDEANTMIRNHLSKYDTLSLTHNYQYLSYVFKRTSYWF